MKPRRSSLPRLVTAALAALALAGLAPFAAAQAHSATPTDGPSQASAAAALVPIPPAGDGAAMIDSLKLSDDDLPRVLDVLESLTGRSVIRPPMRKARLTSVWLSTRPASETARSPALSSTVTVRTGRISAGAALSSPSQAASSASAARAAPIRNPTPLRQSSSRIPDLPRFRNCDRGNRGFASRQGA